jgi:hypothetical protein
MKRRELLKKMSISIGCIAATPALLEILISCQENPNLLWEPQFLSKKQAFVVENLVDLILPSSKTIGAIDVQIPQFIDLVLKDVLSKNEQAIFIKGAQYFHQNFEEMFDKDIMKGNKSNFLILLSKYFKLSVQDQKNVFKLLEKEESSVENIELYAIYKYLTSIRHYTLFGYYTSKKVATEILDYNVVPDSYQSCITIEG